MAEDNDLNAEIAAALLDMEGVAVDRAANGREAVDLFASAEPGRYDFVLMDVKMPVLDGLGAAAEIRALPRHDARDVPIVALTANTFQEDRDDAAAAGMDGLVIEDEGEFLQFLEQNRQSWDYVDQELLDRMRGITRVKF